TSSPTPSLYVPNLASMPRAWYGKVVRWWCDTFHHIWFASCGYASVAITSGAATKFRHEQLIRRIYDSTDHQGTHGTVWWIDQDCGFDYMSSFPLAALILDTASRANENPLSDDGKWTNPLKSGNGNLQLSSNHIQITSLA